MPPAGPSSISRAGVPSGSSHTPGLFTRPLAPTAEHLLSAERSRQEEYAELVQVYRHYRQMFSAPTRWQYLARAGRRVLPLPARADAEGRLWIQIGAAVVKGEFA